MMNIESISSSSDTSEQSTSSSEEEVGDDYDAEVEFKTKCPSQSNNVFQTPLKKRYHRALRHGFNKRRALYHNSTNEPGNMPPATVQNINLTSSSLSFDLSDDEDYVNMYDSFSSSLNESSTSDQFMSESDTEEEISDVSSHTYSDISGNEDDDDDEPDKGNQYIYNGCKQTYLSSYMMIMLLVTKHSLSKEVFTDLLKFTASHLPVESKYHQSIYRVKHFLKTYMKFTEPKICKYCEHCHSAIQDDHLYCQSNTCQNVQARVLEFHDLHLESQLNDLFQEKTFCEMVCNSKTKRDNLQPVLNGIKDVCDGTEYKRLVPSSNDKTIHLTFTMNTDGVALFSSSKKGNLWPIFVAINEIPIKLRFSKRYILPCYLYCQVEKPNMLTYMKPMMETLLKLSHGIEVVSPHISGTVTVKVHLLAVAADLPAKALVANMKQFNGKYGCSFCLDEGESRPNCPMHRFWPYQETSNLRTHLSYIEDVTQAVASKEAVHGVKGASPLVILKYVDLPKIFVIDWMHCVLLGVTKALMKLWLDNANKTSTYYVGDKIVLLNRRLMKIQIPDFVARKPRSLVDHSHWKATEYREWLLHFSIPVLRGVLKPTALIHYSLLVSAMNLLNQEHILFTEITYARKLIMDFSRYYSHLYGNFSQTMNIHQLKHIPDFVKLYGPLFTMSCFGFESMNAHLKNMVHGTRFVNNQVSFAVAMTKELPQLLKKIEAQMDPSLKALASQLSSKFIRKDQEYTHIGSLGKLNYFSPNIEEETIFTPVLASYNIQNSQLKKCLRIKYGNAVYYSQQYKRATTRNSYTVLYGDEKCGTIKYFLKGSAGHLFAVIEDLEIINDSLINFDTEILFEDLKNYKNHPLCQHIKHVRPSNNVTLIHIMSLKKKCVFMKFDNDSYVSIPPNLLEHN